MRTKKMRPSTITFMVRAVIAMVVASLLLAAGPDAHAFPPERRKPQFPSEPGYYVFPTPYSIPGVGEGAAIIGLGYNVADTNTDVFGFGLVGDMQGFGGGIIDIHVIPKTLILDLNFEDFSQVAVTSFSQRGMATDKHDYSLVEFSDFSFIGSRLTSTFYDRRFEVYGGGYYITSQLSKILDPDGNVIIEATDADRGREQIMALGMRFDLTDDYSDPRRGFRLDVSRWWSPPKDDTDPDFYFMEYNTTVYIPLGRISTWVLNYFRSDVNMRRQGEISFTEIESRLGLDCSSLSGQDQIDCIQVVEGIIAANTYGTVGSFGGTSRLRSYPHDRYKGAHAVFYGTELRWNLTEEATPFDIFIAKDIRTSLQVALFYEVGSVADRRDELGDIMRSSYGAGFRMITASGLAFRADLAFGREGMETTIIFGYPWEPL